MGLPSDITVYDFLTANQARAQQSTDALTTICHEAAATWWIDTDTGEDVRQWPEKFFKLWVASKLMLIVTEVAESMEGLRKGVPDDKLPQYRMRDVELADAVIRICDLAGGLGVPLGEILVAKLLFNAKRPDHKIENRVAAGGKSI